MYLVNSSRILFSGVSRSGLLQRTLKSDLVAPGPSGGHRSRRKPLRCIFLKTCGHTFHYRRDLRPLHRSLVRSESAHRGVFSPFVSSKLPLFRSYSTWKRVLRAPRRSHSLKTRFDCFTCLSHFTGRVGLIDQALRQSGPKLSCSCSIAQKMMLTQLVYLSNDS